MELRLLHAIEWVAFSASTSGMPLFMSRSYWTCFELNSIFAPKTIQRMELWVMSNLKWRLCSIMPYDYLNHFITKLHSSSSSESTKHCFLSRTLV
ncbi:hypothetical protein VIGAN_05026600 [Vigna angularis var. angularis]|uniref:B-like cyclin n=1 Tax=Vigna angularis var. angularis TaxID=157739 RepID=A0A0S3S270_PHAAN|nr:hypothetical protein VIGAN_05026600 [Vigna angularis var. angularis]